MTKSDQQNSKKDTEKLEQQIWQDPALMQALELFEKNDDFKDLKYHDSSTALEERSNKQKKWRFNYFAIAASVAFVSLLFFFQQPTTTSPTAILELVNHNSESKEKSVELSDGSRLSLNRHTITSYKELNDMRLVNLKKGEAYFDVAPDNQRPFQVTSRDLTITVLGTAFNLEVFDGGSILEVFHGKVKVFNRHLQQTMILTKGQKVMLNESGELQKTLFEYQTPLWQKGWMSVASLPMKQVISKFNLYSQLPILLGPGLSDLRVSGRFKTSEIEQSLELITTMHDLTMTKYNDSIVLERAYVAPVIRP